MIEVDSVACAWNVGRSTPHMIYIGNGKHFFVAKIGDYQRPEFEVNIAPLLPAIAMPAIVPWSNCDLTLKLWRFKVIRVSYFAKKVIHESVGFLIDLCPVEAPNFAIFTTCTSTY